MTDYFPKTAAITYDQKNSGLAPIADAMHFLSGLMLQELPDDARILCVGIGTGAELFSLATAHPGWTFVGVDPSEAMLDVCRARLIEAGISDRCELIHGYVQDVPEAEAFDAVLAILVGHFISKTERLDFYQQIHRRLKIGGYFVNTELSFDLDSVEFPQMLEGWKRVQSLMGATPKSLSNLPMLLRDKLTVMPPRNVEHLFVEAGFPLPVRFFQAFMIVGWFAKK